MSNGTSLAVSRTPLNDSQENTLKPETENMVPWKRSVDRRLKEAGDLADEDRKKDRDTHYNNKIQVDPTK